MAIKKSPEPRVMRLHRNKDSFSESCASEKPLCFLHKPYICSSYCKPQPLQTLHPSAERSTNRLGGWHADTEKYHIWQTCCFSNNNTPFQPKEGKLAKADLTNKDPSVHIWKLLSFGVTCEWQTSHHCCVAGKGSHFWLTGRNRKARWKRAH